MRIVPGVGSMQGPPLAPSVLTIGNFDGVHLGHRALLKRVVEDAQKLNCASVAFTFEPHPVKVLNPGRHLHRIFEPEDQMRQMSLCGLDALVIEPFSREFSQLPPERFLLEWIFRPFQPRKVVVGYDFSFGANRQGSIDFLSEKTRHLGFVLEVVPPIKVGELVVSSSRIRQALESGDVETAHRLLGRHFYLRGIVTKGAGRGRGIGIPTANLKTSAELIPALGVYAAWAEVGGQVWPAAVNVGRNPTFVGDVEPRLNIEAHLLDFPDNDDLYGAGLELKFVTRLRDERKFNSVAELVDQIRRDIAATRMLLRRNEPNL